MRPVFEITIGENNLTEILQQRSCSISLHDLSGVQNDRLTISFDAGDGRNMPFVELPSRGTDVELSLGYEEGENLECPYPLTYMGLYQLDETELTGMPYRMTLHAHSVDMGKSFKSAQNEAYHNLTLGEIVEEAAARHGYKAIVDNWVKDRYIRHMDQRGLSDMAMLRRLALQNGCDMKIVGTDLLFGKIGSLSSIGGGIDRLFRKFTLEEHMCSSWRYSGQSRSKYKAVRAKYYSKDLGRAEEVEKEIAKQFVDPGVTAVYELSRAYPTKDMAFAAAGAKATALTTSEKTFSFTVAGVPELGAESIIELKNWYPGVPRRWHVVSAQHSLDRSGYVTSCECEWRLPQSI